MIRSTRMGRYLGVHVDLSDGGRMMVVFAVARSLWSDRAACGVTTKGLGWTSAQST